jgi:hypothetical protein
MNKKLAITQKAVLLVAGSLLILIGSFIMISPVDFYASNSIELGANVSLLNELKAPAGLLLTAGLYMIGAIFLRSQVDTALSLAALMYLSYAASRIVSMLFDGVPTAGLVQAVTLETVVGLACLGALLFRRIPASRNQPIQNLVGQG